MYRKNKITFDNNPYQNTPNGNNQGFPKSQGTTARHQIRQIDE